MSDRQQGQLSCKTQAGEYVGVISQEVPRTIGIYLPTQGMSEIQGHIFRTFPGLWALKYLLQLYASMCHSMAVVRHCTSTGGQSYTVGLV